ncbi:MAG: hypothetical protein JW919_01915 [Candidatus Omnitrophica bacterium]|nr:hypothetical protein [Candidatus Omnitrophota bacterium]
MKMVMVSYNQAMDDEVMEVLQHCAVKNYTKIPSIFGKGTSSGTHMGDDIWPGKNNLLFTACDDDAAKHILACVTELRKALGSEGVKAFVLPLEEMTR